MVACERWLELGLFGLFVALGDSMRFNVAGGILSGQRVVVRHELRGDSLIRAYGNACWTGETHALSSSALTFSIFSPSHNLLILSIFSIYSRSLLSLLSFDTAAAVAAAEVEVVVEAEVEVKSETEVELEVVVHRYRFVV
ncbi:hypothetical protein C8J55DRAFT_502906 [Lentinula edodes]|uniref:Uncharacterized protein n=1 Tax=Lentinula lateritia TaxID=40482 RepID=A0A9W9DZN5_9AGAR|nr:hypothetical protein C8J55DRAFT_502906 [Lentinula edodes]